MLVHNSYVKACTLPCPGLLAIQTTTLVSRVFRLLFIDIDILLIVGRNILNLYLNVKMCIQTAISALVPRCCVIDYLRRDKMTLRCYGCCFAIY